jgi:aminoglycoside 6'-N-acetyltransferase
MHTDDLDQVARWLREPHVARWFLAGSSLDQELDDLRRSVLGLQPVHALVVTHGAAAIGWCQWYLCAVDPDWAVDVESGPDDVGIDYAIGRPDHVGRGLGTALVSELVQLVRRSHPRCSVVSDPDAQNIASRRVLEKNGFELVGVSVLPSERTAVPMAVYRLPAPPD